MKTLDQAIGCWTTDPTALRARSKLVMNSVLRCRQITEENAPPAHLLRELELLNERINSLQEICRSGITRCKVIIQTKELEEL